MIKKFFEKVFNNNILYYPGCLTKFVLPDIEENYKKILKKIGIDFIQLKDIEFCCGSPVKSAGYEKDFKDLIERNKKIFKEHGIGQIITNCPACYRIFAQEYGLDTKHMTQIIWNAIKHKKFKIEKKYNEKITYHDPCHLGGHSGIYKEPRRILETLGFEVIELEDSKEDALCCGGGGGLKPNYPNIANKIAKIRLSKVKTKKLITCCPLCYQHLKENAKNIEVLELSQVLI